MLEGLLILRNSACQLEMPKVDHFINSNKNDAIWNGDAIEIAFHPIHQKPKDLF